MTNREAYKDKLDNLLAGVVAIVDGEPVLCEYANCSDCLFWESRGEKSNRKKFSDWLNAEYQEPPVDWNKVPIDTPVLVRDTRDGWIKRHFAGIDENGCLLAFTGGGTSWSTEDKAPWEQMKLAEANE